MPQDLIAANLPVFYQCVALPVQWKPHCSVVTLGDIGRRAEEMGGGFTESL